jgi:radical SAM protein with 4Fe4S-binding SPASM domain
MSFNDILHFIKQAKDLNIPMIRLTGGEPTSHSELLKILSLKDKLNLSHLRLNTNGTQKSILKSTIDFVDSYHFSLNGWDNLSDYNWSGINNSFENKIKSIEMLKKQNKIIRIGTVLTNENIRSLDKIFFIVKNLEIDHWELYRPINNKDETFFLEELENVAIKIAFYSYLLNKKVLIANAIPFCSLKDKNILNTVSCGAIYDDGNSRLIIQPDKTIKPSYYLNIDLNSNDSLSNAVSSAYRKKLLNFHFLPVECLNCEFLKKCRGGSRFKSLIHNLSLYGKDPLQLYS